MHTEPEQPTNDQNNGYEPKGTDRPATLSWEDVKAFYRRLGPLGPLALIVIPLPLIGIALLVWFGLMGSAGAWLKTQDELGLVVYAVGFSLLAGLAILPTHLQAVVGGWAFGFIWGTVGALCGIAGAAMIGYLIARRASGDRAVKLISEQPKWKAVYEALLGGGFLKTLLIVTLVRIPPNSPFAITNMVMAATCVRSVPYIIGTVVGIAPRTAAAVYIGAQLSELSLKDAKQTWFVVAGIIALVVVIIIVGILANRALAKVTDNKQNQNDKSSHI